MKTLIVGLGWLGLPLARHLRGKGHHIFGTTRSPDKQDALAKRDYPCYLFDLFTGAPAPQIPTDAISDSIIVINIAPGRKTVDIDSYVYAVKGLLDYFNDSGARHITFVSTTSVFGEQGGRLVEKSALMPITNSGIAHANIEDYLLTQYSKNTAIIRLAGLIGPNADKSLRHPVYSLIKRSQIEKAHQPVNLVHQRDAIALISAIIDKQANGRAFHACATEHPSRRDYYSWAANKLKLGKMDFVEYHQSDALDEGKIIDASDSLKALEITLKYPSPYNMLATTRSA